MSMCPWQVQIKHRLGRSCREGTVQAELLTESVKLGPPLLSYERGDKMELPMVTGIGFSSQRLSHRRWTRPVQSAAKLCKIQVASFF